MRVDVPRLHHADGALHDLRLVDAEVERSPLWQRPEPQHRGREQREHEPEARRIQIGRLPPLTFGHTRATSLSEQLPVQGDRGIARGRPRELPFDDPAAGEAVVREPRGIGDRAADRRSLPCQRTPCGLGWCDNQRCAYGGASRVALRSALASGNLPYENLGGPDWTGSRPGGCAKSSDGAKFCARCGQGTAAIQSVPIATTAPAPALTIMLAVGFLVGGFIGFLMRPSVLLIGQLPFGTVVTRGSALSGIDQLLVPTAQQSFNASTS